METIKVNMSPNPLDVQTIHASQNDGEARQWEFELHNNGELIDTSEITEQMFFKSYKGGTEQILPENTSTPTTSPFKGDIKYPQGELTDQEFLYRESPTQKDGLAKLTRVKGNTLAFNQLVNNGNFASTSGWTTSKTTLTVSDNVGTIKITEVGTATYHNSIATSLNIPKGHKILVTCDYMPKHTHPCYIFLLNNEGNPWGSVGATANVWNKISVVIESSSLSVDAYSLQFSCNAQSQYGYVLNDEDKIKNIQLIDLTLLNSSYITDYNSFKSYFPLSYYSYNQGTLLPFKGTAIKTTGTNLIDYATIEQGSLDYEQGTTYQNDTRVRTTFIYLEQGSYTVTSYMNGYDVVIYMYNSDETFDRNNSITNWQTTPKTFTMAYDGYAKAVFRKTDNSIIRPSEITSERMYNNNTESTTNLPTLTYFPTGMKSAGSVYDELTDTKAITRVGTLVFDNAQSFTGPTSSNNFWMEKSDIVRANNYTQTMTCDKLDVVYYGNDSAVRDSAKWISAYPDNATSPNTNWLYIHIDGITTKTDLNTWLQANPVTVNYELKTPTETSFTTASLVTENTEIPLSNEDGVLIGKCTEQLSENPGFIDAKIKLSDTDGECYSNKIQLHIERSPQ